jgi:50S ribosomal subunit-associated GTPase HflX
VLVLNKIDLLGPSVALEDLTALAPTRVAEESDTPVVLVSAMDRVGFDDLLNRIQETLHELEIEPAH